MAMANIETVCPFFSVGSRRSIGEKLRNKFHFHLKKMDFVSNNLLVCTLHVIIGSCGARVDNDEKDDASLKGRCSRGGGRKNRIMMSHLIFFLDDKIKKKWKQI